MTKSMIGAADCFSSIFISNQRPNHQIIQTHSMTFESISESQKNTSFFYQFLIHFQEKLFEIDQKREFKLP